MPVLIPLVSSDVNDVVASVKESATTTLEILLKCSGNSDLDAFTPAVLQGIKSPDKIYDCVEALASCVSYKCRSSRISNYNAYFNARYGRQKNCYKTFNVCYY